MAAPCGNMPRDLGAPLDRAVEPLPRVGAVRGGEGQVGEDGGLGS
jgi:hypothetical protein